MIDFDTYLTFKIIAFLFGTFVMFPLALLWIKHSNKKHNED